MTTANTFDRVEELICIRDGSGHPMLGSTDSTRAEHVRREFAAGLAALDDVTDAVSVFGSACTPSKERVYELARRVAANLGQSGYAIMTGGGSGIMEAANRGAHDVGALSIGLRLELSCREAPNPYVDRMVSFRHSFVRQAMFVQHASAFVVFPGDYSTLHELFGALTSIKDEDLRDLPLVLVGTGFWQGLVDWLDDRLVRGSKLDERDVASLLVTNDADEVVEHVTRRRARPLGALLEAG